MSAPAGNLSSSVSSVTAYHAKYYAHDLTRRARSGLDRIENLRNKQIEDDPMIRPFLKRSLRMRKFEDDLLDEILSVSVEEGATGWPESRPQSIGPSWATKSEYWNGWQPGHAVSGQTQGPA